MFILELEERDKQESEENKKQDEKHDDDLHLNECFSESEQNLSHLFVQHDDFDVPEGLDKRGEAVVPEKAEEVVFVRIARVAEIIVEPKALVHIPLFHPIAISAVARPVKSLSNL